MDPAASSFYEDGAYNLAKSGQGKKTATQMTAFYKAWLDKYPIVSLEDGLAENDWAGFREQTAALGNRIQIVGDDIYVTNTKFIARGIEEKSTNAVLIKLNQIGSVTETIEAIEMCRKAGWGYVVSHRSGETEDAFLADFAVAMGGGQIKTGSACRSERIAKYNRLLEIGRIGQGCGVRKIARSCHVWIVYLFDVEWPAVSRARKPNRERQFSAGAGNPPPFDHFEMWSQNCLRALDGGCYATPLHKR